MNNTNKTFCVLPWISLTTNPDGSCKPCCVSADFIKKNDGTNYNLGIDKIEDIYNSPDYIKLRQQMLDNEKVPGCSTCYKMEDLGGKSLRETYNTIFFIQDPRPVTPPIINYFDLRFGNLCNLSCRSCAPSNSSQMAKEIIELSTITTISKFKDIRSIDYGEWYNSLVYDKNIDSQVSNVKMIYLTGGEPTIIQKNFDMMSQLIDSGHSKNIMLKFNSNMTNTNPKFYNMLSKFKSVTFLASIDGYGMMQEYLRYPSSWKQIDKTLKNLIDTGTNILIRPTPVIQITNINKIVELFEYFENHNKRLGKFIFKISPIILETPNYLDISNLPVDFTIESWDKIEKWINSNYTFRSAEFITTMQALKKKCYDAKENRTELNNYVEYNSIFDKHRSHYLIDVNPELHKVLV